MRILVVEDDPGSREALRALLEILGHEVDEAENGERAIALARDRGPALILMDVGLPGLSGHEAATRIRGECGGEAVYVAAFTGHRRPERAASDGFDAYLLKPVALEELLSLVESASRR